MKTLNIPISDQDIRALHVGDSVLLNGIILTGRDSVHKWLVDSFIKKNQPPERDDTVVYKQLLKLLDGGVIYHCGPVVSGVDTGEYRFTAAGPTTSTREEPYQGLVMEHFNIKAVIGKGGMGKTTLKACEDVPGVYLHAIGGAASLIAQSVKQVTDVFKLEF